MDPVEKLIACEEIRQLLSRRTRLIDGKHWDQLVEIYTEDMPSAHTGQVGGRAQVEHVAERLKDVRSIHRIHLPEIEITSPTTAKVIAPMEDVLLWEKDGVQHWAHGYGLYHQELIKTDRGWLISKHNLTRQYLEEGYGPFDPSTGPGAATKLFQQPITFPPAEF